MVCTVSTSPVAASTRAACERRPLCELPSDAGLPVEPANSLLESITGPVHLRAALKLAVFERQLEGLALVWSSLGASRAAGLDTQLRC